MIASCHMKIDKLLEEFIARSRVARLATTSSEFRPHVVPVVFVFDGNYFLIPIDSKRKRTENPENLKRIRNIKENSNVSLLIDEYSEDWTKLRYVIIHGKASIVKKPEQNKWLQEAYEKLVIKYPQYQKIGIGEMCIIVEAKKVVSWRNS